MRARIFNPSHDECLASGSPYYTPSKTAQQMDEVQLPGWLRLCDITDDWLRYIGGWEMIDSLEVWGWDARIAHQLRKRGCPAHLLPSEEQLARIRQLSSRQTVVRILPHLPGNFQNWWINNIEQVKELSGELIFKSPWSCSGRGVFPYNEQRIHKVIREQGGIEVEPLYNRVADFAMEFRCHADRTEYLGLSAMLNDGFHGGNLVLPEEELLQLMLQYVDLDTVNNVREELIKQINIHIAPHYEGPLGVDQMIVRQPINSPTPFALHPCVELNLRYTMGHVALEL